MANKRVNPRAPFAKRSLGQNFLVDPNYVRKIVGSLGSIEEDLVIEIGPGRGALTSELQKNAKKLIGVELDRVFASSLREKYRHQPNVEIFEEDILKTDISALVGDNSSFRSTKFVANLPYNISTAILEKLSEVEIDYSEAVLMFQKEVVERISAEPSNSNRGYLTVITEARFHTEYLFDVPPKAFKPVPKVMSAVVRLRPRHDISIEDYELFRKLVSAGFRQKRKTLANNLKQLESVSDSKELLSLAGIDPRVRAEAIRLEDWITITKLIANK